MGNIFKQVLPIAATAAGAYFAGPAIAAATGMSAGTASIVGGALGNMAGSAISGGQSVQTNAAAAAPPAITPPPTMPTAVPDSQSAAVVQQQSIASQIARRGRASTIMTNSGMDSGTKLGS